jgi:hypothetical protein
MEIVNKLEVTREQTRAFTSNKESDYPADLGNLDQIKFRQTGISETNYE